MVDASEHRALVIAMVEAVCRAEGWRDGRCATCARWEGKDVETWAIVGGAG
jgi:hypothetical protein